ncbi:MAG: ABC-F family ATP-binding cassette domain-containing protein [Bacteroidales bacterium]|jgi:ATP-binding cassette subfamily F protein uup|nr:ABC-F family ATP-binding cassette domain-containing protein [Bacteroidales bacterium]
MNYLSIENLSKSFGEKILFDNISFGIERGQKVALVARNGSGKTTLLNIITGKDMPDSGTTTFRKGIRTGYLPQNPYMEAEWTLADYLFQTDQLAVKTTRDYEEALLYLKENDTPEAHRNLEACMAAMDAADAWSYEDRVKEVVSRLALPELSEKLGHLSGGQQKKVALAKVLIDTVDLLMLDEPTNHLDIAMTEWLENFLSRQNLALLLITHDRAFLDAVCEEIIEIDHHQIFIYKGNYAYFLEKKAEREAIERAEIEKAQNTYRRELDWMRRMPSARGTKSRARKEAFYELKEKATRKIDKNIPELSVKSERLGGKILEMYNIEKSFGEKKLIDDFSYTFKKGEKIGIVGSNGIGKTTLLNMITGSERPDRGKITVGQSVKFGYYNQNGLTVEEDKRVIDIVKEVAEIVKMDNGAEISASQFLTYFQFDATTQYNYFSNLSGGEKRRLYLLRTLMSNPNFLILDEPTNDLDVFTLMLLEDFLSNYGGCLLVVSHDRSFMDNLVDHIFIFEGDGKIKDYYGTYSEYKASREKQIKDTKKSKVLVAKAPSTKPTYKQQKEYEEIEAHIGALEKEKTEIEALLSNTENASSDTILHASRRISEILHELSNLEARWFELAETIAHYE